MNSGFWRNRRVLLTGHTGFKGSWLSIWLHRLGADLTGYSLDPPTKPNLFTAASVDAGMKSIHGDVRDLDHLSRVFEEFRPEVVLHLAAQSLVRASYDVPVDTYDVNVLGTVKLLEASRHCPDVRSIVIVTSDKCYDNKGWHWGYRENDRLGGRDPYSNSKACAELVTDAYRASFFSSNDSAAVGSARAGNVIGGGDWAVDRLVPDLIRGIVAGTPVPIRNPNAVRPWQHVLEPLCGYLELAERLHASRECASAWNFGPDQTGCQPVSWVAKRILEIWGDGEVAMDAGAHPEESVLLKLDSSKAREILGWRPRLSLDTALEWTVEWHQAQTRNENLRALTEDQIRRYEAMIEC